MFFFFLSFFRLCFHNFLFNVEQNVFLSCNLMSVAMRYGLYVSRNSKSYEIINQIGVFVFIFHVYFSAAVILFIRFVRVFMGFLIRLPVCRTRFFLVPKHTVWEMVLSWSNSMSSNERKRGDIDSKNKAQMLQWHVRVHCSFYL